MHPLYFSREYTKNRAGDILAVVLTVPFKVKFRFVPFSPKVFRNPLKYRDH